MLLLMYEYTDKNLYWQNDFLALDESAQDDKIISCLKARNLRPILKL